MDEVVPMDFGAENKRVVPKIRKCVVKISNRNLNIDKYIKMKLNGNDCNKNILEKKNHSEFEIQYQNENDEIIERLQKQTDLIDQTCVNINKNSGLNSEHEDSGKVESNILDSVIKPKCTNNIKINAKDFIQNGDAFMHVNNDNDNRLLEDETLFETVNDSIEDEAIFNRLFSPINIDDSNDLVKVDPNKGEKNGGDSDTNIKYSKTLYVKLAKLTTCVDSKLPKKRSIDDAYQETPTKRQRLNLKVANRNNTNKKKLSINNNMKSKTNKKSFPSNKSVRSDRFSTITSKQRIYIRLPPLTSTVKKSSLKKISSTKPDLNTLRKKYGSKLFSCRVKLYRWNARSLNQTETSNMKTKVRKSVSFVETVEVFGDSDDDIEICQKDFKTDTHIHSTPIKEKNPTHEREIDNVINAESNNTDRKNLPSNTVIDDKIEYTHQSSEINHSEDVENLIAPSLIDENMTGVNCIKLNELNEGVVYNLSTNESKNNFKNDNDNGSEYENENDNDNKNDNGNESDSENVKRTTTTESKAAEIELLVDSTNKEAEQKHLQASEEKTSEAGGDDCDFLDGVGHVNKDEKTDLIEFNDKQNLVDNGSDENSSGNVKFDEESQTSKEKRIETVKQIPVNDGKLERIENVTNNDMKARYNDSIVSIDSSRNTDFENSQITNITERDNFVPLVEDNANHEWANSDKSVDKNLEEPPEDFLLKENELSLDDISSESKDSILNSAENICETLEIEKQQQQDNVKDVLSCGVELSAYNQDSSSEKFDIDGDPVDIYSRSVNENLISQLDSCTVLSDNERLDSGADFTEQSSILDSFPDSNIRPQLDENKSSPDGGENFDRLNKTKSPTQMNIYNQIEDEILHLQDAFNAKSGSSYQAVENSFLDSTSNDSTHIDRIDHSQDLNTVDIEILQIKRALMCNAPTDEVTKAVVQIDTSDKTSVQSLNL